MVGPGRPTKGSKTPGGSSPATPTPKLVCEFCGESKRGLKYVLPTQKGNKEFCTELCLAEFRMLYKKVSFEMDEFASFSSRDQIMVPRNQLNYNI